MYFADSRWWAWHRNRPEFQMFYGDKCTIMNTGSEIGNGRIHMLRAAEKRNGDLVSEGLSSNPEELCTGCNGGYQLINLLALAGVQRIVLLGFDGKPGEGGKKHWFGDHPAPTPSSVFEVWVKKFRTMVKPLAALGVEVINANPNSAIDAFKKVSIESVLPY